MSPSPSVGQETGVAGILRAVVSFDHGQVPDAGGLSAVAAVQDAVPAAVPESPVARLVQVTEITPTK